eukprot:Hpha_TRINITY_DN22779_c0_g1::TRINITY_DN22779_c0_g1_i1::g.34174::m.34174
MASIRSARVQLYTLVTEESFAPECAEKLCAAVQHLLQEISEIEKSDVYDTVQITFIILNSLDAQFQRSDLRRKLRLVLQRSRWVLRVRTHGVREKAGQRGKQQNAASELVRLAKERADDRCLELRRVVRRGRKARARPDYHLAFTSSAQELELLGVFVDTIVDEVQRTCFYRILIPPGDDRVRLFRDKIEVEEVVPV